MSATPLTDAHWKVALDPSKARFCCAMVPLKRGVILVITAWVVGTFSVKPTALKAEPAI